MKRVKLGAVVASVALSLSACGGGGGGGATAAAPVSIKLSGVAASGFLNGATVTISCASTGTQLGQTTTATDGSGSFSLSVNPGACSGPILTTVTSTTGTTMVSKLDPTKTVAVGAGLTLRRYEESLPTQNTSTLYVTPLSEFVAATALRFAGSGAPSAGMIAQAIVATTTAFGFSQTLLQAPPVPANQLATATQDEIQLYQIGAAIEEAASSGASLTAVSVQTALGNLETLAASEISDSAGTVRVTPPSSGSNVASTINADYSNFVQSHSATDDVPSTTPMLTALSPTNPVQVPLLPAVQEQGIVAATNLASALRSDLLSLWNTSVASPGFLSTQAANIKSDFANLHNIAVHEVIGNAHPMARCEVDVVDVGTNSTSGLLSYSDNIGSGYVDPLGECVVYTNLSPSASNNPVVQFVQLLSGSQSLAGAGFTWYARPDLPYSVDSFGNTTAYVEFLLVLPSNPSQPIAQGGAGGSWKAFVAEMTYDATGALTGFVSGSPPSQVQTGTYSTSSFTNNTGSGANAGESLSFSLNGSVAVYDNTLDASGNPIPDVGNVNLSFSESTAGSTSSTGQYVPSSGTINNLSGGISIANCAPCGLQVSNGTANYAKATGGTGSMTIVGTTPAYQFTGTLDLTAKNNAPNTGDTTFSGSFSGTVASCSSGTTPCTQTTGWAPPFFAGSVTVNSLVRNPVANGSGTGHYVSSSSGGIAGTVTTPQGKYTLSATETSSNDGLGNQSRQETMTYLDPASLQVNFQATQSTTSGSPSVDSWQVSSGDTTILHSPSGTSDVYSAAAGYVGGSATPSGQIGTLSGATFEFDDGSYFVL